MPIFFHAFTEICCLVPCPIAFIVFAIPPVALALRRRQARIQAAETYQEYEPVSVVSQE